MLSLWEKQPSQSMLHFVCGASMKGASTLLPTHHPSPSLPTHPQEPVCTG